MNTVVQIGTQTITAKEIIPLLGSYQLLPQLLRGLIVDQAIASVKCNPEETAKACQQFWQQHQVDAKAAHAWLEHYGITTEKLEAIATRQLRLTKFKQATWGEKLEAYFLERKPKLDKVTYSLIRTQSPEVAQELYFRIQAGEQSFSECAQAYSQGPEAQTGGLNGPVELQVPHPNLAKLLACAQPGQLLPPTRLGKWLVIVRLETLIPAELDDSKRSQLLQEMFETWISEQVQQEMEIWGESLHPFIALANQPYQSNTTSATSSDRSAT